VTAVDIARLFAFVRESQDSRGNRGLRVEAIQHWSKGATGDSWCCEFATMVLDLLFHGAAPIDRMCACQDVYELAEEHHWIVPAPNVGDLFLYVDAGDHAHHIGFVTAADPLRGIAGNTSADGTSSNGDGVHEHALHTSSGKIVFVAYPRPA
jgi:hypothetical protein